MQSKCLATLFLTCVAVNLTATRAIAQPGSSDKSSAAATELQELVRTGITAYRKNDFPTARGALLAAIRLSPEPSFVAMLADTEMKLSRFRDAAEHWTYYLTLLSGEQASKSTEAEAQLEVCRKHVGSIAAAVEPQNAVLLIDGSEVDLGLVRGKVWVEPGTHTIQARNGTGSSESKSITVGAGEEIAVSLVVPRPVASPPTASSSAPVAISASLLPVGASPASDRSDDTRTYVLIGGVALTAVAAGIGTAYWVANRSAKKDADSASQSIGRQTDDTSICGSGAPLSACSDLQSARDSMKRTADISDVSFVAAGVLGAATIGAFLLWPKGETPERQGVVGVSPFWSPTSQGVTARVRF